MLMRPEADWKAVTTRSPPTPANCPSGAMTGMDRVARGKYEINFKLIEENTKGLPHGELTRKFACYLQEDIFANKVNWLWSHKRWKRDFREEEIVEYERLYGEKPFEN